MPRWLQSSMKCAPLSADSLNRMPLLAMMPTSYPWILAKHGHQRLAVELLELVHPAAVDDAADDLAYVVRRAGVGGHHVVERLGRLVRLLDLCRRARVSRRALRALLNHRGVGQGRDDAPHDPERVGVVVGEVVDDPGGTGMHVTAAEVLGRDDLAGRGLHQRRPAEEDRALVLHDHGLVAHRGDVGATCGAGAHDAGDLWDAAATEVGLVEEDPAEVLAVGEDVVLHRQERAPGVDEVDAGQVIVARDRLCAQVLLDGHRVVGAALDGGVVGDDHHLAALDTADAGDDAGGGHRVVLTRSAVHAIGSERAQLEERAARVEQAVDPIPHQELATTGVLGSGTLRATLAHECQPLAQVVDEVAHAGCAEGAGSRGHPCRLAIVNLCCRVPPVSCRRRVAPKLRYTCVMDGSMSGS